MTRLRMGALGLAVVLVLPGCTAGRSSTPTPGTPRVTTTSSPSTLLASGEPLPPGCNRERPSAAQTVAFVAEGRAWALDPGGGTLTCLFKTTEPGPFIWGPLGDRVLLGGLRVRGTAPGAPARGAEGPQAAVADWGHPVGIAIVFAEAGANTPEKLFLEDDRIESLRTLPNAKYLDIAYHPSGLALAFIIERGGRQSIWFSTNEGKDAKRLVFSKTGTRFTHVAFSHDGRSLLYTAEHAEGFGQVHSIDLTEPGRILEGWKSQDGQFVRGLFEAPHGRGFAVNLGESCETSRALALAGRNDHLALPDEERPTSIVGWLEIGRAHV